MTNLSTLPAGEKVVLTLVAARLLCATDQAHRFEAVTAVLDCGGCSFTAKGKTVLQMGWKEVERLYRLEMKWGKAEEQDGETPVLPELRENQAFQPVSAAVREGGTSPPRHYTEDFLLAAMETAGAEGLPEGKVNCPEGAREGGLGHAERKGLGTPATRAAILEKLV